MYSITLFEKNTNRSFTFSPGIISIGKSSVNDFQIKKNHISRHHARLFSEKGEWFLFDLDSTNGTFLNGERLQPNVPYRIGLYDKISFSGTDDYSVVKLEEYNEAPQFTPKDEYESLNGGKKFYSLPSAIKAFVESNYSDSNAFEYISKELSNASLYFPVREIANTNDPDSIVSDDFLAVRLDDGVEYLPMFTSRSEIEQGPAAKFVLLSPEKYIEAVSQASDDLVINPFTTAYKLSSQWLKSLIMTGRS